MSNLYASSINAVKFSISSPEEINKSSFVNVTSYDLFRNNTPYPNGLYDAHMGTNDHSYKCQTCYQNKRNCLGHEGEAKLRYPVWVPIALQDGKKWLKLICFECGNSIIPPQVFNKFNRNVRLDEASKIARGSNKECHYCKAVHPLIKKDIEPLGLNAEFYEDKKLTRRYHLYPHMALEIFSKVSDETVIALGRHPDSHPRNFVVYNIPILPVPARPDTKKMGGARSKNDDITTAYQIILKRSEGIPTQLPAVIDAKLAKQIYELNAGAYDLVKSSSDNLKSIQIRLKGKQGRFRKTQLGKRVHKIARTTIRGDPTLEIDQLRIPMSFARKLQMEEVVQEFNKQRLMILVQNGRRKYPGATKVIKKGSRAEYDVDSARGIELEDGDIVLRDFLDNDPVNFNRQPSLIVSNISCMRVVVNRDESDKTFGMNVIICKYFNADFDGDQMSIIVNSSEVGRHEIRELCAAPNWFISHTTSSPALGQLDDSIISTFELTRTGVVFDKYHAMLMFQNTTKIPDISTIEGPLTGRDCVSLVLPKINMTRVPDYYKPNYTQWVQYDPTEIKIQIKQGKLLSGVLDKKSIGAGANGGVYHLIAADYGNRAAFDAIHAMQQLSISYIMQKGFTVGITDLLMPDSNRMEIMRITSDLINKSLLLTERLHDGEIIPPVGKTVEEFYEEQQIAILSVFDDFTTAVISGVNPRTNGLFKLFTTGSKGKSDNFYNMVSAVAQKQINGERIRQKFGYKRTAPYYRRFESDPVARGFITNSYLSGMTVQEYISNAEASRFDLISKALSTSVTGEQNRKSVKNLESIIITNLRCSAKATAIVQFAYGEDYLDPAHVERVSFPTVMISDDELKERYLDERFPEFYQKIVEDRQHYRNTYLKLETMHVRDVMASERRQPVDCKRIMEDVMSSVTDADKFDEKDLPKLVEMVEDFISRVPYFMLNPIQENAKSVTPDFMKYSVRLFQMLIRCTLNPKAMVDLKITPTMLGIICARYRMKYAGALIDPGLAAGILAAQSFSEPLTQYMLDAHHRSASGGTSKSGMQRTREVLNAVETSKLEGPSMFIPVTEDLETNKPRVQEIANTIEMMTFGQFVHGWQIFNEKYGQPVHSMYKHETSMIEEFAKRNPLLTPPSDLIRSCIRFSIQKSSIMLKNMPLSLIIMKLREKFPDAYIIHSGEADKEIVIRAYIRNVMIKSPPANVTQLKEIRSNMMNTIIRGVEGVVSARVEKLIRNRVQTNGSIIRAPDSWCIMTTGTNLAGVMGIEGVDKYRCHSDAIQEMAEMFGVEAARHRVISSLRDIVDSCNERIYMMYADEMTWTGKVTSIASTGLKKRERSNVLLRIGNQAPMAVIEEAAIHSLKDTVNGITAPLLLGTVPTHGTLYNRVIVNEEFASANAKKSSDLLAELLD